jgi:uncharacterized damage-inducible protein DinB
MRDTLHLLKVFPLRVTKATEGVTEAALHAAEREGGWSVADVVAHLGDVELVYAVRIRTMVASTEETPLVGLDQNAWIERVHRREGLSELLEQFSFQRATNIALFERLTDEELDRRGIHPHHGPMTVRDAAERLASHDAKHLAQLERIKAAV